ncbi:uncharacterized protein G2W53_012239 [Senna tora]|uniref:Uncharacterized protein n=1 Tax=Senna tora TaxID=362788 RepID=A0A834U0E0_9FABA|nr:uncharacterized protein G2W53_012239 [Senna tora]
MLKVILSVDSFLKTKQDGILCVLKDALTDCGSDGYEIAKSLGGERFKVVALFCCYKVVGFYPSAPSSLCSLYAWTPQFFVLADQLMSAFSMAASHSNAKSYAVRCLTRSKYILGTIGLDRELSTKRNCHLFHGLDSGANLMYNVPPWSHTLALLVLEWRSLAISLLTLAMKFSICGGRIICLQQVGASRNIPSKALLGSSRSIEGSWFFFGFFVSAATTSLGLVGS